MLTLNLILNVRKFSFRRGPVLPADFSFTVFSMLPRTGLIGCALTFRNRPTRVLLLNVKQLADQLWRYDPAHATSPADAKRRMAPGGTEADLRVRLSKPAGSAINVIEEQS